MSEITDMKEMQDALVAAGLSDEWWALAERHEREVEHWKKSAEYWESEALRYAKNSSFWMARHDEAKALADRRFDALSSVRMLKQLGGMWPATQQIVQSVVEIAEKELQAMPIENPAQPLPRQANELG